MGMIKYMMQANLRLFYLLLATVFVTGCQKVINLDLKTANSKLVINGYVTDQPGVDTVTLTLSGSYFTPGSYPKVNGAFITISDNTGFIDTLQQVDTGKYATTHLLGVSGNTYTLRVHYNGKEYSAVSTMQKAVEIDSLYLQPTTSLDTAYRVRLFFTDPVGIGNFYKGQLYINGHLLDDAGNISLGQDKYVDGTIMNMRLRGYDAQIGDTVKASLLSIDGNTFNYFTVVRSLTGNGNPVSTAVPQNPPTNIIGDAVGYFAAYPVRSKSVIVQ